MGAGRYDKVVVVGLDGADWRLLKPWLAAGELPTLARLVDEGSHHNLRSTIRPESSVAWSSFATGVNPGKHGVFGFVRHVPDDGYSFALANGSNIRFPRFWDLLSHAGRRVGLLNVPFTYPPSPLNGFLVSGMLTPGTHVTFTHPPELQQELTERFEDYRFDPSEMISDTSSLLEAVQASSEQQRDVALWLLERQALDFFCVVFTGPDRLQHFLWNEVWASPGQNAILDHYRQLDSTLAQMIRVLPERALLFVMSDHGFNGVGIRFNINRWLQQQGLLVPRAKPAGTSVITTLMRRLRHVRVLRFLKARLLPAHWGPAQMKAQMFKQTIDWHNTQVYYAPDGGLRLNVQGREPTGVVPSGAPFEALRDELREELLRLVNPATGQPVVEEVYRREELYHGPHMKLAPDLIVEPQRELAEESHNVILDGSLLGSQDQLFSRAAPYTANHAAEGILVVWGEGVAQGSELSGAHLVDLAPTILAALDVAVPGDLDGRVLSNLFQPEWVPELRITHPAQADVTPLDSTFDEADEEVIASRLRDLGYIE